jgi:outer membrane lipoprotein-sorting protein
MHGLITLIFSCALMLMMNSARAAEWGVTDLMQILSEQKARKASFVEKKYIATLQQPLESSGELSFTAPDRLEKRITKPKSEAVILQGDKLFVERSNGRKLAMSLSDRPEVAGFVESIRATLIGDRAALEKFYVLSFNGAEEQWQLSLTPVQPQMLKIISEIRIAGAHATIGTIEFLQADGDRSVMTIKAEDSE